MKKFDLNEAMEGKAFTTLSGHEAEIFMVIPFLPYPLLVKIGGSILMYSYDGHYSMGDTFFIMI